MESKLYTKTTNMFLEILKDLKQLQFYQKELKKAGLEDFVEICNKETDFETKHTGYAASLYRIRRIENHLKQIKDSEYINLFQSSFIILNQHRLLNLNTLQEFKTFIESKINHVIDKDLYLGEEEVLDFTFNPKVIDLINLTRAAVSLEPNNKYVSDRHYILSRKKLLSSCAKSLVGINEVFRRNPQMNSISLDAIRYYVELLLEELADDEETIKELQWILFQIEKGQTYNIEELISRKWNLKASDVALLVNKFMPNFVYGYSGIIKDIHVGIKIDKKLDEISKTMVKEELAKDK